MTEWKWLASCGLSAPYAVINAAGTASLSAQMTARKHLAHLNARKYNRKREEEGRATEMEERSRVKTEERGCMRRLLVAGNSTLKVGSRAYNLAVTRLSHNDPVHTPYLSPPSVEGTILSMPFTPLLDSPGFTL